jgi:hypothetical protein
MWLAIEKNRHVSIAVKKVKSSNDRQKSYTMKVERHRAKTTWYIGDAGSVD